MNPFIFAVDGRQGARTRFARLGRARSPDRLAALINNYHDLTGPGSESLCPSRAGSVRARLRPIRHWQSARTEPRPPRMRRKRFADIKNAVTLAGTSRATRRPASKNPAHRSREPELTEAKSGDIFWSLATLGESALVMGGIVHAKYRYGRAAELQATTAATAISPRPGSRPGYNRSTSVPTPGPST
jgi:hypothetical protein